MNKRVINILNAATKYAQDVGFQAADVQVALGQSENNPSQSTGYFSKAAINNLVTELANKFSLDDSTNGRINIVCVNGVVSFATALTNQKQLNGKISAYLAARYSADMAKKIAAYCAAKKKAVGSANATWISF